MGCRPIVTVVSWPAQITFVAIKLGKQLGQRPTGNGRWANGKKGCHPALRALHIGNIDELKLIKGESNH